MSTHGRFSLASVITVALLWAFAAQADAHVYFTHWFGPGYGVSRADNDGSHLVLKHVNGGDTPGDTAVDREHVYWTNQLASTIGRANLDGSGATQSFITTSGAPQGIDVDDRYVYWSNNTSIGRANLDGTGIDNSFVAGLSSVTSVAVDGGHIYWTSPGAGVIGRANLDGTGVNKTFLASPSAPRGVVVDDRHIFWSKQDKTIARANLNGTGVDQSFVVGASDPEMLAVDGDYLFWANFNGSQSVGRAELDGSGVDDTFITGAGRPVGVAVDDGPWGHVHASAAQLAFAGTQVGTLGPGQPLTIENDGQGPLRIDAVRTTGDEFLIGTDGCSHATLAPAASCVMSVRFGPTVTGLRSASLEIAGTRITLSGTGVAAAKPATGPAGPRGATGPQGRPGKTLVRVCKTKRVKKHGKRVKRRRCKTKVVTTARR